MLVQEFWFIFIFFTIFFLLGAIIVWKIKKILFQVIAKNPEKLVRRIFGFASKFGIKTAPLRLHWESVIGEKIVDFGIIEKRFYGNKYFIETRAFLCEGQGEKHITLQVIEAFERPGIVEYSLGVPQANWYILRPQACKLLEEIMGQDEEDFINRYHFTGQAQTLEQKERKSSWLKIWSIFLRLIGIIDMKMISVVDNIEKIIIYDEHKQARWTCKITAYTAKEYDEPLLVLMFYRKIISVQRLLGFIPKGVVRQNYIYPFGEKGRIGLRKAIQQLQDVNQ